MSSIWKESFKFFKSNCSMKTVSASSSKKIIVLKALMYSSWLGNTHFFLSCDLLLSKYIFINKFLKKLLKSVSLTANCTGARVLQVGSFHEQLFEFLEGQHSFSN